MTLKARLKQLERRLVVGAPDMDRDFADFAALPTVSQLKHFVDVLDVARAAGDTQGEAAMREAVLELEKELAAEGGGPG